jgi:hypothetical protein
LYFSSMWQYLRMVIYFTWKFCRRKNYSI